jgi:hypothetical protein
MGGGSVGTPVLSSATELWNGTSWTSNPTGLATGRSGMGSGGTQTSAITFGGYSGSPPVGVTATEAWNSVKVQTITVS